MPAPLLLLKAFFAPAKIMGFISGAAEFCMKYWKQILVLSMIFTIFHQNFMQFEFLKWFGVRTLPGIVQEYEEKIDVLEQQLAECELSRATLTGEIESLNTQVDKWADVSSQLQNQHDNLVNELGNMRQDSEQAVNDILAGPTPESCEAAIRYLREAAGELKWQE